MQTSKIKAFLLDNDGVICDSNRYHWEGYRDIIKQYYPTIDYTMQEHNTLLGINTYDTFVSILTNHGFASTLMQEDTKQLLKKMEHIKVEDFKTRCEHATAEVLFDGMPEFLKEAHEAGIKLIICSSSSTAGLMLKNAGVIQYIDYVVNPRDQIDCITPNAKAAGKIPGKPAPDLFEIGFLRACELVPNLQKHEVLGFEDATNGVAAIKGAGIRALYVGDPLEPNNQQAFKQKYNTWPDYVVAHSSEITLNKVNQLTQPKSKASEQVF